MRVRITPAQAAVLDLGKSASESLEAAREAGVTWTRSTLTVPDTAEARTGLGFYVGSRGDIASDNLASPYPGELDAMTRGEYRATLNLGAAMRAAGISTEYPYTPLETEQEAE